MMNSPEVKAQLIESLKESEELKVALQHIEEIIIKHTTDKCGDSPLAEAVEIIGAIVGECSQEIMDGIKGVTNIPSEWKLASKGDWVKFFIELLVDQGKIISGIWIK